MTITISVLATVAVWFLLWLHSRARQRRRLRAIESCDCSESLARAQRMDDSVKRTLAEIDSRDPDKPPMTQRLGASTVTIPGIVVLLAGMFIAGGAVQERTSRPNGQISSGANSQVVVSQEDKRGRRPGNTDLGAKLAELRTRPTLAAVSYFRARPASPETIAAMQVAATSADPIVSQAAQVALAHWRKSCIF